MLSRKKDEFVKYLDKTGGAKPGSLVKTNKEI